MTKLAGALVAEAIGVFGLCFIGIMAINLLGTSMPLGLIGIALAHGLILSIMISVFAAASGGHLNPAVTIGLLVGGKIKPGTALAYIAAQVFGGVLAGLAAMSLFTNGGAAAAVVTGTPAFGKGIETMSAFVAEMIGTFFLVTAVWGTAVDPRAPKIGGFGIGLTVTADILAIGPLTGAAMNPARVAGPAIAASLFHGNYDWSQHWVYWAGPVLGGVLASVIYKGLIYPKEG